MKHIAFARQRAYFGPPPDLVRTKADVVSVSEMPEATGSLGPRRPRDLHENWKAKRSPTGAANCVADAAAPDSRRARCGLGLRR